MYTGNISEHSLMVKPQPSKLIISVRVRVFAWLQALKNVLIAQLVEALVLGTSQCQFESD